MPWLDARGGSYLGWTWNTWDCGRGPALIADYRGTPTPYGRGFRDHLASLVPTTYTLALSATGGGTATASPAGPTYPAGAGVTLTATPAAGYRFAGWTVNGAAAGSANPFGLVMDGNKTVVANFAPAPGGAIYTLTLTATAGGGPVAGGATPRAPSSACRRPPTPASPSSAGPWMAWHGAGPTPPRLRWKPTTRWSPTSARSRASAT